MQLTSVLRRAGLFSLVPCAIAAAQVIITNNGQPFAAIDSTWSKPIRRSSPILVKDSTVSCTVRGNGGDAETNRRKNRSDEPDTTHLVTLDAIRALVDSTLWHKTNREAWEAKDRVVVFPYEGIPVTVVGFLEIVRPQSGHGEGTNCGATAERDTDWHVALVAATNEREEQGVVVEPTPRTKRRNDGWKPGSARQFAIRQSTSSARDTTVPQVRNNQWVDLNDISHN